MKVVLSRKGTDSAAGGMDSPILPDGTLLSLPIPAVNSGLTPYCELHCGSINYLELIHSLKPAFSFTSCHLDPDIYDEIAVRPKAWQAAFGQSGASASHLDGNAVGPGDLFLFFGRFRQTEWRDGKLAYTHDAHTRHIIFGYLSVGSVLGEPESIRSLCPWHPHAAGERQHNRIYLAERHGTFHFHESLVLTKPGQTRLSRWSLPEFFSDPSVTISYHQKRTKQLVDGRTELDSVGRGQEFVITAESPETERKLCAWAEGLLNLD